MTDSETIAELTTVQLGYWIEASMSILAIYEYLATVDQEVTSIWRRRMSVASLILLATRWTMFLAAIISFMFPKTLIECKGEVITSNILGMLSLIITAVFSGLRVYALWGGSFLMFSVGFFLQLPTVVVNMYADISSVFEPSESFNCVKFYKFDVATEIALIRVARIPAIVGDAFVVGVTWVKSFQQLRRARHAGTSVPLSTLIFRDGTVYFLLLFVMNVLELCTNLPDSGETIAYITATLPLILINRFMLNLKQLNEAEAYSEGHVRTLSTPMFRISVDIAGNMGESLDHCWSENEGEGDAVEGGESIIVTEATADNRAEQLRRDPA